MRIGRRLPLHDAQPSSRPAMSRDPDSLPGPARPGRWPIALGCIVRHRLKARVADVELILEALPAKVALRQAADSSGRMNKVCPYPDAPTRPPRPAGPCS